MIDDTCRQVLVARHWRISREELHPHSMAEHGDRTACRDLTLEMHELRVAYVCFLLSVIEYDASRRLGFLTRSPR